MPCPILSRVKRQRAWAVLRTGTRTDCPIPGPVESVAGYSNACGTFGRASELATDWVPVAELVDGAPCRSRSCSSGSPWFSSDPAGRSFEPLLDSVLCTDPHILGQEHREMRMLCTKSYTRSSYPA